LEDKPGIIKTIADHMTQEVQIYFDEDQITLRDIEQSLERLGYPVDD
jgi:copper chaperone CopZ